MKFTFKIQKYQTQAVDAIVKCFEGQQFADKVQYLRDKGIVSKNINESQGQFNLSVVGTEEEKLESSDFGYGNASIAITNKDLLDNIHKI